MKLTGYSSSVFVRPGGSLGFHVHSESPNVDVQLVRLLHGDEIHAGRAFRSERFHHQSTVATPPDRRRSFEARSQSSRRRRGSSRETTSRSTFGYGRHVPASADKASSPGAPPNARKGFALRWTRPVGSSRKAARGRSYAPASRWRVVLGCVSGCGGVAAGSSSPSRLATIPRATRRRTFAMHCTARISCSGDT